MGSIYHLRTEEQYRRGLAHESTVQGTYMFLARWNGTPNKYRPLRVIRSLIQASFLHVDDLCCTQSHPLKGCGAVWRPAGDADRKMETQPQDTSWPGYYYYYYYYYYLYTTRDPNHSCHWILDQSRALHWSAHLQLKLSLLLYEQGSSWWWG